MPDTFFCENLAPGRIRLDAREEEHLFRILRAAPGTRVRLIDGRGRVGTGTVADDRHSVEVDSCAEAPRDEVELDLYLAPPRKQKLDTLLKQCAELGVHAIHLMRTARSVALPEGASRWRTLLVEGCKQSGNPWLPEIHPIKPFAEAMKDLAVSGSEGFFGAVRDFKEQTLPGSRRIAWVLGPEGGFTEEEEKIMIEHHVRGFHLNTPVLRLETAAVAGAAVLKFCAGRLGLLLAGSAAALLLGFGATGCAEPADGTHPLYKKAVKLRNDNQFKESAEVLQRYLLRYPGSPAGHMMMGSLCDENLNRGLDAIYHYNRFIELAPQSPDAAAVKRFRELARKRVIEDLNPEIDALRVENKKLRTHLNTLKKMLFEQQKTIQALRQARR